MQVLKFVAHSKRVLNIAIGKGWYPGARYTNLRDVRGFDFEGCGFLDIDWKDYAFVKHLDAVAEKRPRLTIARDVECILSLDEILLEAERLLEYSDIVAVVPKDPMLEGRISELVPEKFILGYSVPTRYGGTSISVGSFDRPVHLLGGRPDVQRKLADSMDVFSFDCNRFTYDACFGDYFDGSTFRPHPVGGYERCLEDSLENINRLWEGYSGCNVSWSFLEEVEYE